MLGQRGRILLEKLCSLQLPMQTEDTQRVEGMVASQERRGQGNSSKELRSLLAHVNP